MWEFKLQVEKVLPLLSHTSGPVLHSSCKRAVGASPAVQSENERAGGRAARTAVTRVSAHVVLGPGQGSRTDAAVTLESD